MDSGGIHHVETVIPVTFHHELSQGGAVLVRSFFDEDFHGVHAVEEGSGPAVWEGHAAIFHDGQVVESLKEDMGPHVLRHRFFHGIHKKFCGSEIFDIVMEAGKEDGMGFQLFTAHISAAPEIHIQQEAAKAVHFKGIGIFLSEIAGRHAVGIVGLYFRAGGIRIDFHHADPSCLLFDNVVKPGNPGGQILHDIAAVEVFPQFLRDFHIIHKRIIAFHGPLHRLGENAV